MRHLNNSKPLAVTVSYPPPNTFIKIVAQDSMSTTQFYRPTANEWFPDHTHAPMYDDGQCVDGPLRLRPQWMVADPDHIIDPSALSPTVYWYVNGQQITSTSPSSDYYVDSDQLVVRKNLTHLTPATIYCECRVTDPRTSTPLVLSDTITLVAVLHADEQWCVELLSARTRHHHPLSSPSTQYSFVGEARLGSAVKTADVAWFWDYSLDNGANWSAVTQDKYWYVSGLGTSTLVIDVDYVDSISIRCRINTEASSVAPDIAAMATGSISWLYPDLRPYVYSLGGDKVMSDTTEMTFGLMVHRGKQPDLTLAQQRDWLLCSWVLRQQGSQQTPVHLDSSDVIVTVPDTRLRSNNATKYIVDPNVIFRGPYDAMITSGNDVMQTSAGDVMFMRN